MTLADDLTAAYRLSTVRLRARVIASLLPAWRAIDKEDVSASWPFFSMTAAAIVGEYRGQATKLAHNYMRATSLAAGYTGDELGGRVGLYVPAAVSPEKLTASLTVTGLVAFKRGMAQGRGIKGASDNAFGMLAGAAGRLVDDAGRESIIETVREDISSVNPIVEGWQRVTSSGSCDFCQLLSGRGAVYTEDTSSFRSHDHCACSAKIVYRPI